MQRRLTAIFLVITLAITLLPYQVSAANGSFTDVKPGAYYADAVAWAVENEITKGTSQNTFSPNEICTRAQVVTFLWRSAGSPEVGNNSNPFSDVAAGSYYYKAVLWALENEITSGTGANEFSPTKGCTRGQVVTFLYRAAGKPSVEGGASPFTDVRSNAYYADAVQWAVENEITKGTGDTTFSPDATCTRGQIVTFLWRYAKTEVSSKNEIYSKAVDDEYIASGTVGSEESGYEEISFVSNEVIVVAAENASKEEIGSLVSGYHGSIVGAIEIIGNYLIELETAKTQDELEELIKNLEGSPLVADAYLNTVSELMADSGVYYPADKWNDAPWNLNVPQGENWGLEAIRVPQAWRMLIDRYGLDNKGGFSAIPCVSIGVIDSLFYNHPDIAFTEVTHTDGALQNAETAALASGTDNEDLYQFYAHGTHVAGTIAATTNNEEGISGIALNHKLYGYSTATGGIVFKQSLNISLHNLQTALGWLLDKSDGKMVINFSMENHLPSKDTEKMEYTLHSFLKAGYDFVICAAAGNKHKNAGDNSIFCRIEDEEIKSRIIVVGAAGWEKNKEDVQYTYLDSLNYGARIDVAAPGLSIYSTVPKNEQFSGNMEYDYMSATSMATPHVSGTAALIWAANPGLSGTRVKNIIVNNANIALENPDGARLMHSMINAEAAVAEALQFLIQFDANGGTGTMPDETVILKKDGYVLPECGFNPPKGKVFKAWRIDSTEYAPGDVFAAPSTGAVGVTITAVWEDAEEPGNFVISFDANGGTGTMSDESILVDGTKLYYLPECGFIAPEGMVFKAWRIDDTEYAPGDEYTISAPGTTTVYAVWESKTLDPPAVIQPGNTEKICAGRNKTAVISSDGTLWVWGSMMTGTHYEKPVKVMEDAVSVSAGSSHVAVIKNDDTLWTLGINSSYQLGDGTIKSQLTGVKVMDNVSAVSAGGAHTAAIKSDGSLWTWGSNSDGQLCKKGSGGYTPEKVADDVIFVSAGAYCTGFIKSDGSLWMCGDNSYGQLGDGSMITRRDPVRVLEDVSYVSVGGDHTAAIKRDGSLWIWGRNEHGQVGDGTRTDQLLPVKVMENVAAVSVEGELTAVLTADGSLWGWGYYAGASPKYTPEKVMENVAAVSTGAFHFAVVKSDGTLWVWGDNNSAQIGVGSRGGIYYEPVKIMDNIMLP